MRSCSYKKIDHDADSTERYPDLIVMFGAPSGQRLPNAPCESDKSELGTDALARPGLRLRPWAPAAWPRAHQQDRNAHALPANGHNRGDGNSREDPYHFRPRFFRASSSSRADAFRSLICVNCRNRDGAASAPCIDEYRVGMCDLDMNAIGTLSSSKTDKCHRSSSLLARRTSPGSRSWPPARGM